MPAVVSNGISTIGIPSSVPSSARSPPYERRRLLVGSFALCLISRPRNVVLPRQLGERPLLFQPRAIILLFLDDDLAPHLRMRGTAEFRTENLECSGAGGREPVIRNRARYHIHLRPELGHIEIMQDVNRAEQYLNRLSNRQVQSVVFDDDVVLSVGIV